MTQIFHITCTENEIIFHLSDTLTESLVIDIFTPNSFESKKLRRVIIKAEPDKQSYHLDRFVTGFDGLYLRYKCSVPGIQFVDDIWSKHNFSFLTKIKSKKGLRCVNITDGVALGMKHTVIDLPMQNLFRTYDEENCSTYSHDGNLYYIKDEILEVLDKQVEEYTKNDITVLINLLVCTPVDDRMKSILEHPNYNPIYGRMSAINVTSAASCSYLEAICKFLAERYSNEAMKIEGVILANEINVGYVWANAGNLTCEQYMTEYTRALRLAWQAGCSYCNTWEVYISLENHWSKPLNIYQNLLYLEGMYPGKSCLEYLNFLSVTEGNFNWNIAFHPYAYNIRQPDFYNDDYSTQSIDTEVISFRNLNVLVAFLRFNLSRYQSMLSRKIVLSEQGFNSDNDAGLEYVQAAAYGKAFKEVMKYPEIQSFIYHSHCDNPNEEGLKLGLRRNNDFTDEKNKKPIYELFKSIENIVYDNKPLYEHF